MNICVFGASSDKIDKKYIKEAEFLGEELAKRGHSLVFGGGNFGEMGAVARGAYKNGGKIIGVAPKFFDKDGVLFENCTDFVFTETMRERKAYMEDNSDAFIICPGGIGTFEEYFEVLVLKQLGQHSKPIAILNTNNYYEKIHEMLMHAKSEDFMENSDTELSPSFENVSDIITYLENYKGKTIDFMKEKYSFLEEK